MLAKWLGAINAIQVKPEPKAIYTQGTFEERFQLYDVADVAHGPKRGRLEFGVWDYVRKWRGYKEFHATTGKLLRKVPLAEVAKRFRAAVEQGQPFPFLHDLTYRTQGWQWDFGKIGPEDLDTASKKLLSNLSGNIIRHFFADVVESRVADFGVHLDLVAQKLQVLDTTPGGNGLSESLLADDRLALAFQNGVRTLSKFEGKASKKKFEKYVVMLCRETPTHSLQEVTHVFRELLKRWAG